ncbi:GNAT family N-acetyltransferase [Nonomuraea soli]|uniref:Diamine N-acetyltransferase n=1 Tax=Nonomuraea soli TaxID=1032476 RepID=A0A7W0HW90_9ACTN|nr:GNAT family N-acetyltransferase [Nonomuraea soli]MBA2897847.1 diamine N-acetyltransferase [Nonomuraea soli]
MNFRLVPVTQANIDLALTVKVRPDQERFVAPVAKSLAEAYVFGDAAWPRLILDADDKAVGFLMAFVEIDWNGKGVDFRSGLWRLNVMPEAQGRGVGRFAVEAVAAEVRRRGARQMFVSWEAGDDGPENFYLKLGFRPTGETTGGQPVGVLDLG